MIEGLSLLPETMQVQWHHFGAGVSQEKLEDLAKEKLRENVQWTFHGFVPNGQLGQEYRNIRPNLFITTSSTEGGAPVSIQEAFSMGIPAVGTRVGGIPDLILEGQTGFLLQEEATPTAVAEALLKYAALSEGEKNRMAAAARHLWKENFNAQENALRFTAYLRNLISE